MRARDIHCSDVIDQGKRAAWRSLHVLVGLMAHTGILLAQVPPAALHAVAASEQAARDNDRIAILRQELKKSEEQLESLAHRKAERLAASDMQAANETEEQRVRTLGDIAGLRREIASASHIAASQTTVMRTAAALPARSRPVSGKGAAPAPWWDVYGNGRRFEAPASRSLAPGQGSRAVSTRPLE